MRLEVAADIGDEMLDLWCANLISTQKTSRLHRSPLDLSCLLHLMALDRPDLKDTPWPPVTAGRIAAADEGDRPIFDVVRHRAVMLHHPYESFSSSIEEFIPGR